MNITMRNSKNKAPKNTAHECYSLFETVEEAWFWFIAAQQAREDGARYISGMGKAERPCEPIDILKALDGLYRKRRLVRDHLLVLRHYGKRFMAPDPRRVKEQRAYYIWTQALERLGEVLEKKGIIDPPHWADAHQYIPFSKQGEEALWA